MGMREYMTLNSYQGCCLYPHQSHPYYPYPRTPPQPQPIITPHPFPSMTPHPYQSITSHPIFLFQYYTHITNYAPNAVAQNPRIPSFGYLYSTTPSLFPPPWYQTYFLLIFVLISQGG